MEESRTIALPLGDVSLDPKLGVYYIDMRPARVHYESNIWNGGYDKNGVPMIRMNGEQIYYPINIAQYGFMLHADWLKTKDDSILERMKACLNVLEDLKSEDGEYCIWWHQFHHPKYGTKPPWPSAMAQGEVASFYLRMYQITDKEHLLDTAKKSCAFLRKPVKEKGVLRKFKDGNIWLEEYPSDPPSYVLNGFIYAIFGLYDLYRVTKDVVIKSFIDECIDSLVKILPEFTTWYWSLYDLRKRELVRYYYQKNVHLPQMEVLYMLTGEGIFDRYRKKWSAQLTGLNFLFVRLMYRIRPRIQKITGVKDTSAL